MLTKLPIIMTKNGQKLKVFFTSIEQYPEEGYLKFDMKFNNLFNNSHAGTTACIITEYHTKKKLDINIKSADAFPIGHGIGTSMLYSFFRWIYFSYPGYEFHFTGVLNTAFDQEYLIAFYKKVGFTVKNGYFYRIVPKEEFTNFCLDVETRISDIYSNFTTIEKANYDYSLDQAHRNLLDLEKRLNEISIMELIKQRYFYR
ncbi:GNAT family N-acetyltransferase [Bacillus wiedmannii]|uniref:GNAT family N-acetyltransferase n=1 Tax=Bacillus wiedmannii TaxID=1890302 RepID=UPI002EBF892A|nr:GNAT family N-acetyltransferase [Bacillus wiedmannii]